MDQAHEARATVASERLEIVDLLGLFGSESVLSIEAPSAEVRAAYRRAISRAIMSGQVPAGQELRHSGRDSGDMTIRLVPAPVESAADQPPPPVPVPDELDEPHPAVRALLEATPVGGTLQTQQRAMRILHGIAVEAERRGWLFSEHQSDPGRFRIAIGPDTFDFALVEETDRITAIPEADLATAKYDWQRLPTTTQIVASGRLALELHERYRYRPLRWADRKRWALDDKLPEVFRHIEDEACAAVTSRDQARSQAAARRRDWEAAVTAARSHYVAALNRDRIADQVSAWRRARDMRGYAAELAAAASSTENLEQRAAILAWAESASAEADRLDPLLDPDQLRSVEPETIAPSSLDSFMPAGMLASQPPPEPDSD